MRLLHLTSTYAPHVFGGAEKVVQCLAEHQAADGWQVGVTHLVPKPAERHQLNGVDVLPLQHRNPLWLEDSARYPGVIRKINKVATIYNYLTARDFAAVLDSFLPDILHTHSMPELTPMMWAAASRRRIQIVHTLHDFDLMCVRATLFKDGALCSPRHLSCRVMSLPKRISHRHVSQVVGVSQSILDMHRKQGFFQHLPEAAQHVIWNPVQAKPDKMHAPPNGPISFGFLGRLVQEKGIDVLLDACRAMPGGNWQVRIAGRSPTNDADLRRRAEGLPVVFEGFVTPKEFFRKIDVLVVPALWSEPFGLTVIEALLAGVPVIGSDIGGVGEIIRTIDESLLVPAGDAQALAKRMSHIVAAGRENLPALSGITALRDRTRPSSVVQLYRDVYALCQTHPSLARSTFRE